MGHAPNDHPSTVRAGPGRVPDRRGRAAAVLCACVTAGAAVAAAWPRGAARASTRDAALRQTPSRLYANTYGILRKRDKALTCRERARARARAHRHMPTWRLAEAIIGSLSQSMRVTCVRAGRRGRGRRRGAGGVQFLYYFATSRRQTSLVCFETGKAVSRLRGRGWDAPRLFPLNKHR